MQSLHLHQVHELGNQRVATQLELLARDPAAPTLQSALAVMSRADVPEYPRSAKQDAAA